MKVIRQAQTRVAVGLSGGVDSAVGALLLKQQGYDVVGVHLVCWPPLSEYRIKNLESSKESNVKLRREWIRKNGCHADEDRAMALKTALELNIPFKVLDFSEEYNRRVVDYFYREYEAGRTPNPDVLCNSEIKFGLFLDWALQNGFDFIATGHYALLRSNGASEGQALYIPKDKHKDQTYFLWKLTQKELSHVLFPLGELQKGEVRKLAKENKLSCAERPDSQGICFIGEVEVGEFLRRRLKENPGDVLDINGGVIGKHKGVAFYTIGQRGGWTIFPKIQKSLGDLGKMYVIEKDAKKNVLVVGERSEGMKKGFGVGEVNWIDGGKRQELRVKSQVWVRIRHGGKLTAAKLQISNNKLQVETDEEMFGVASGQSVVFYSDGYQCLGGGVIQ